MREFFPTWGRHRAGSSLDFRSNRLAFTPSAIVAAWDGAQGTELGVSSGQFKIQVKGEE